MNKENVIVKNENIENEQFDFDEHEKQELNDAIERKQNIIWFGEPHLSFKKRAYQFVATLIMVMLRNFTSKLSWQFSLVLYLVITVPIGTYVSIKFIINLFIK